MKEKYIILKMCTIHLIWDWEDFGVGVAIFKNNKHTFYEWSFDVQILWFNIWIEFCKRKKKNEA